MIDDVLMVGVGYANNRLDGDIAEVMIFDRKVTEQERFYIHAYLAEKWGIDNRMDSDGDGTNDNLDSVAWNPSVTEVDSDGDGFANSMEAN